jgi:23S rRNA (cytidine1920-2'-O)/16S rRNA (cytidine1409-2'-O)-methyltransferase
VDKPGTAIDPVSKIELHGEPLPFVSRGGYKLDKALKVFPVDPAGKTCLDCGASTGGFTDVLLQHGAGKVYAVDVGYGQLAWKLRTDERVVNLERTNLRYITPEQIPEPIALAVMDVSFISIRLVIPAVKALLLPDADFICLIKPQFEAGREEVGKKGVVRDSAVHERVIREILDFIPTVGMTVEGLDFSPIKGPEGNIEYLCHLKNRAGEPREFDIPALVASSHEKL